VELVRQGQAELLMKGSLHTDELLGEVVARETGLRTGRRPASCSARACRSSSRAAPTACARGSRAVRSPCLSHMRGARSSRGRNRQRGGGTAGPYSRPPERPESQPASGEARPA
jgi:hypothetical protein